MRRMLGMIVIALATTAVLAGTTWAAKTPDDKALRKQAAQIDQTAAEPRGEKTVVGKLEQQFNVTEAQIQALRSQNMGYGNIAIVFGLAQTMPGGITDANVNAVMTMRQGPPVMGWGQIAKQLGTKLGPATSQVKKVNTESRKEMKQSQSRMEKTRKEKQSDQAREMRKEQHREMKSESRGGGMGKSQGKGL